MIVHQDTTTAFIFESALFRTTTTLIIGVDHLLLVDPNWLPGEIEEIREQVGRYRGGRSCYLLFTHSDYDHIIGYGRFSEFTVIASRAFVNQAKRAEILKEIHDFDDQYYIQRDYPITYPTVDTVIENPMEHLRLGREAYDIYQAPGHNDDAVVVYNRARGILIAGDYLSNIEFPYVYDSVTRYRDTLDTLERILAKEDVRLLVTGHGDATSDPEEMHTRLAESRKYLESLERSVREGSEFDLPALFRRYAFPGVMSSFHAGNVKKMVEHVFGGGQAPDQD